MGSRLAPLGRVLAELASRPYAGQVHAHWSHDRFFLGTAPSYAEQQDHPSAYQQILCIEPAGQRLRVGYGPKPGSEWGWRKVEGKVQAIGCWELCSEREALAVVDRIVLRDLMAATGKENET